MARFLWVVLGLPVGIILVALGVANRQPVTVALDPFRPETSPLSIHPPLFIAFFAVLAIGVLIGGVAVWLSQHKYRRALHRARDEASRLRTERDQLVAEQVAAATAAGTPTRPALAGPRRAA